MRTFEARSGNGVPHPLLMTLLFVVLTAPWLLWSENLLRSLYPDFLPPDWFGTWEESMHLLVGSLFVYLLLRYCRRIHHLQSLFLRTSIENYRSFYEEAPIAYQSLDRKGILRKVNTEWERLTGYSREEVIGRPMLELVAPEAQEAFQRGFARFLRGEDIHGNEMTLLRRDGSRMLVSVESRVIRRKSSDRDQHDIVSRAYCALFDVTEKRQTEQALKESESRLSYALDNANDGVWDWRIDTDEVYFSPRWETMLGFSPGEFPRTRKAWYHRIHPKDRQLVEAALTAYFEGHSPEFALDYRLLTRSGAWKWILIRGRVVEHDDEQRPTRMVGTHVDIDRRKTLEQRLLASEQRYRLASEAGRVAAWELHIGSGMLHGDSMLFELLGMPRIDGEQHWSKVLTCADADSRQQFERELERIRDGASDHLSMEMHIHTESGQSVWLLCNGRLTGHDDGGERILGICVDITHGKLAELALREEHQRAERYLEVADVIMLGLDTEGRIELLNRKGYEILGYPAGSLEGRCWFDLALPEEEVERIKIVFNDLIDGKIASCGYVENEIVTRSGDRRMIGWRNALVRDDTGKIAGTLSSGIDITELHQIGKERERLRRELAQAQKMEALGRLTGGIAHDFNNILASVLGYTGLALERFGEQSPQKLVDYLQEVKIAGERAKDMVAQLLRFSRKSGGTPVPFALAPLVKEVVKMLEPPMTTSIRIETEVERDVPDVMIDPIQAHQVLVNLCINARDAMEGRGLIRIRLRHRTGVSGECATCHRIVQGEWVELSVSDQGKGIAQEDIHRIFDPFYTTKTSDQGSGIGLAVTRSIVEQHGGHILVESTPGSGSRFQVLFPVAAAATDEASPAPALPAAPDHDIRLSGHLLIVDDEHALKDYLADLLQAHGCRVTTFDNGKDAFARFSQDPDQFDLLLSDQTMPGMTGEELARRALALRPDLPVIIYSGYSETLDEERAESLGIRRFFHKPVDPGTLLTAIDELLR